jgi:anti-sigma factor RsiW
MKVHSDVIRDLLPLYVAGEGSPATRALVEQGLADDPELARLVRELAAGDQSLADAAREVAPAAGSERRALDATRRWLRRRSQLMALALAATLLPLSFSYGPEGLHFFVLEGTPWAVSVLWTAAVGLWIAYWHAGRRLRVTGL